MILKYIENGQMKIIKNVTNISLNYDNSRFIIFTDNIPEFRINIEDFINCYEEDKHGRFKNM